MSKNINSQIPWFATSNGVIDLQTSADHRDHRYTHNTIEDKPPAQPHKETRSSATSKQSLKLSSNVASAKVREGGLPGLPGLPPLLPSRGRPLSSANSKEKELVAPAKVPPAPKDNELYGDILVIPPIRQKPPSDVREFSIPTLKVFAECFECRCRYTPFCEWNTCI